MGDDKYRMLSMGEIVQAGDEVLMPSDDKGDWDAIVEWIPAQGGIGREVPDPKFPAHCQYRRLRGSDA